MSDRPVAGGEARPPGGGPTAPAPIPIETKQLQEVEPRSRPFDPAAARERARLITLSVFLFLLIFIVIGAGVLFVIGRFSEQTLLVLISSFFTLLGTVIGFYFGQESAR